MTRVDVWGRERPEQNRDAAWPFADGSTLRTRTGLEIPRGVMVDARLSGGRIRGAPALTTVTVVVGEVSLWFGDAARPRELAARFDPDAVPSRIGAVDFAGRPAGLLVVDPALAASLGGWPVGEHPLESGAAELAAAALAPGPSGGVSGIHDGAGPPVDGDVWLVGRDGVALIADADANAVRVHATGDPLWRRALCDAAGGFETPAFVKTINSVKPNARGEFLLLAAGLAKGRTILRVEPEGDHAIKLYLAGH